MHVFTLTLSNFKKIMLVTEYEVYYNSWVKSIRKALGYSNLNDHYSFVKPKKILGEGQFGEVRLAIHIKSNQKVAIKVVNKSSLKFYNYHCLRNEQEILKISQHPNIVKILNVYENTDYMYIGI